MLPVSNAIVCRCESAGLVSPDLLHSASSALEAQGYVVHAVHDLCELASRRDPMLARLAQTGSLKILACYPRAVRWLFAAAGAPLQPDVEMTNLRTETSEIAVSAVLDGGPPPTPGGGSTWFPVIDFDRCTHCLQCLSFCLFGVFAVDQKHRVTVRSPENCKPNCPACSRVCPEVAIIFPKYKAAPINGDAPTGGATRETVKVDISSLLGGDVYSKLRERGEPRFSKERDPARALRERQKLLATLVEFGDIQPELLSSLRALNNLPNTSAGPELENDPPGERHDDAATRPKRAGPEP
ncbi:MAG TPA: ferredoxin family protein [Verrucomicrobiae bacterium]